MAGNLLIYWDYELQKGADQKFLKSDKWDGYGEYKQTELVLKLLDKYDVKTTFAVLGYAAKKGKLPYHAPEQIRKMHSLGHEVASHSQNHEYIPDLNDKQIEKTLIESKKNIEKVIKDKVYSFVPPYNMPLKYFGFNFALKHGKLPSFSKVSVERLLRILSRVGYKTCRLNKFTPIRNKLFDKYKSYKPRMLNKILTVKLNCHAGFLNDARQVVNHAIKTGNTAVIYAHPHALGKKGRQSLDNLKSFLVYIKSLEKEKKLKITTPYELYKQTIF